MLCFEIFATKPAAYNTAKMSDSRMMSRVLAIDRDFGAGIFAVEHLVAHLHLRLDEGATVSSFAFAHGHYLTALRLLLGSVRNDDAGLGFLLGGGCANNNAVGQRFHAKCHGLAPAATFFEPAV